MPGDLDRFYGRNASPQSSITYSKLETRSDPAIPCRLFTIPLDILEHLLDRLTKRDAFRLSRTCRALMSHPVVLKALFYEPISHSDIANWFYSLRSGGSNTGNLTVPPITWGINPSTGPFVRRMVIPEWISLQELKYLTAHCPNLHAIDLTGIFKKPNAWYSDSDSDPINRGIRSISWKKMIILFGLEEETQVPQILYKWKQDGIDALFQNLRSIHLPYGYCNADWTEPHRVSLPPLLRLARHLDSLELSCQQNPTRRLSSKNRRETATKLLTEILDNVSNKISTLALYNSASTIHNLDVFLESLAAFRKLRTIKVTLHHDLGVYRLRNQPANATAPILSSPTSGYEHSPASALQCLSLFKKINDRGRFSLVSSDRGDASHSFPCDYYGLCHTQIVHGSGNSFWTPVWTWEQHMSRVESQQDHSVEILDSGKCRKLFEELMKARIPVSLELGPLYGSGGAFFAGITDESILHRYWGGSDDVGTVLNGSFPPTLDGGLATAGSNVQQRPRQHFIQRSILTTIRSKNPVTMPLEFAAFKDKLSHIDHIGGLDFPPLALAARVSPEEETSRDHPRGDPSTSNAKPHISPQGSVTMDSKKAIPDPIWQLNEIGDLVDDLRIIWDGKFAVSYAHEFRPHRDLNPDWSPWSQTIHSFKKHLRDRLWRESEQTALLFRRIKVDFPRLTRLALYIPTALYPDHDQTFIKHVLPGTGWTVRHNSPVAGTPPSGMLDRPKMKFASDLCPFIRRTFTRPTPTSDPAAVIVHDDEWHVTKRPLFDLDGEYKSMEQLLTEPLWENYTEEP